MMRQQSNQKPRRQRQAAAFQIENAGDQIVKRITFTGVTLATGGGTAIPVTSIGTNNGSSFSAQANGAEWASFAARYQQYRVRAIRVTGKAVQPVQTATVSHSDLFRGDYIGSAVPGTAVQVFSDENVKVAATCRDFRDVVSWKKNPNARLWNPTSATVPAANSFAWVAASPTAPALTTATTYYAVTVEWEVEFRGSQ